MHKPHEGMCNLSNPVCRAHVDEMIKKDTPDYNKESGSDAFVSPKDQGGRREGYVDPRYADLKKRETIVKSGSGFRVKSEKGKNLSSPGLSKKAAKKRLAQVEYFKHKESKTKESRSVDDEKPPQIDLKSFYKPSERISGWKNSSVYSPPILKQQPNVGVVIKEF